MDRKNGRVYVRKKTKIPSDVYSTPEGIFNTKGLSAYKQLRKRDIRIEFTRVDTGKNKYKVRDFGGYIYSIAIFSGGKRT